MKVKTVVASLVAASLLAGGPLWAQGKGDRDGRGNGERSERDNRNDDRRASERREDGRGPDGRGPPGQRKKEERRTGEGAGPNHSFYRGDRLPMEYRHHSYLVDDWRGHRLSAPPRGYHWVQTGGDYVLVAIATGVILELILGR